MSVFDIISVVSSSIMSSLNSPFLSRLSGNDRVSWNVELVPKMLYGGTRNMLHVDGISEYYLERSSGLITQHRVSHLLINDAPVTPVNGIFHALAEISPVDPETVPVYSQWDDPRWDATHLDGAEWTRLKFQTRNPLSRLAAIGDDVENASLFAESSERAMPLPESHRHPISADSQVPYDRDALQRKNASRKKFGLPPISPEEFIKEEGGLFGGAVGPIEEERREGEFLVQHLWGGVEERLREQFRLREAASVLRRGVQKDLLFEWAGDRGWDTGGEVSSGAVEGAFA